VADIASAVSIVVIPRSPYLDKNYFARSATRQEQCFLSPV
jgi:hypothetical protein